MRFQEDFKFSDCQAEKSQNYAIICARLIVKEKYYL